MSLTDGIVGCWSPSVRGSGYLLPDLSGRGNHGVLTNMDAGTDWPPAAVRGSHGRVLDFDGTNDRVECGSAWSTLQRFTLTMWWNQRASGLYAIAGAANNSLNRANFYIRPGINSGFTGSGGVFRETPFPSLTTGVWSLCVTSYDGSVLRHYLNGVLAASVTFNTIVETDASTRFAIGRNGAYAGQYGNGLGGEVAIYNRTLTSPEVAELYRQGNGAIGRQLTGQTRRRVYGFVPAGFKPYWARRQNQIIGGGV